MDPLQRQKRLGIAAIFVIALLLGVTLAYSLYRSALTVKRGEARELAFHHSQRIALRLQEATGPAYMLASLVQQGNGQVENFDELGAQLVDAFPIARAVELAPGGVVRQVYPLRGNESIIGHDLLKDRGRNQEAHLAIARRQLTIGGPFDLLQGGVGVVARYPVYLNDRHGRPSFWGFSIVLIRVPELLNAAGLMELTREGYRYSLCRLPMGEGECVPFARQGKGAVVDAVQVPVNLPNGFWQLSVSPEDGWVSMADWIRFFAIALVLPVLLTGLALLMTKALRSPPDLAQDISSESDEN